MFTSCKLRLEQKADAQNDRYVEVKLINPQLPPGLEPGITMGAMYEWLISVMSRFQWWGEWRLVGQSGTADVNAIGTAPPEARFWRYSATQRRLEFLEVGNWGGGGLSFGEVAREAKVAVALFEARMSGRGIEPFNGTGSGTVEIASVVLQPRQALYWERIIS
jgi:hypothetical protein